MINYILQALFPLFCSTDKELKTKQNKKIKSRQKSVFKFPDKQLQSSSGCVLSKYAWGTFFFFSSTDPAKI